jgi:nucleoside-diphosphate-sugar epimerase
MSGDGVHVVFGAGQVGRALSSHLTGLGLEVRVVSRSRPDSLESGVKWRAADASDPTAAVEAAEGASVVYQCLNAPYAKWPECFPPLQRSLLGAAEQHGALLVTLENVYGYGSTAGRPMTEDLPLAARSVKGRTRAAMTEELLAASEAGRVRIAIGRAADFFGAGVTETTLGERVFANALAGKRADFLGDPELPHTYSYVPDVAAGLATLGTDERAVGGVWHLPVPETLSTAQILEIVAAEVGHPVESRSVPKLLLRALGLVNPTIRGLAEIAYQVEESFVLDTTKYRSVFGDSSTPFVESIAATVDWYGARAGTSAPKPEGTTA